MRGEKVSPLYRIVVTNLDPSFTVLAVEEWDTTTSEGVGEAAALDCGGGVCETRRPFPNGFQAMSPIRTTIIIKAIATVQKIFRALMILMYV
ncbi:MAG: hypothetical protein JO026_00455 [Patescibacteria group bacterium]|nr:hypothetical protein [Patescibacteria group bacterium]